MTAGNEGWSGCDLCSGTGWSEDEDTELVPCPDCTRPEAVANVQIEVSESDARALLDAWYGADVVDHRAAEAAMRAIEDAVAASAAALPESMREGS